MTVDDTASEMPGRSKRLGWTLVLLGGVALVLALAWIAADNRSRGGSSEPEVPDQSVSWERQDPAQFADTISTAPEYVVNVHVPYEGELSQTDANIAFDQIVDDPRLPADKTAPIALYCRSGSMSTIAAEALVADGRRNLIELEGGMNAWEQDGRSLVDGS